MTMAKRSSRAVTVDERPYRFNISPWSPEGTVRILVEDSEHPGHLLETKIAHCHDLGGPQVAAIVRAGLRAGWKPMNRGRFHLDANDAYLAVESTESLHASMLVRVPSDIIRDALDKEEFEKVDNFLVRAFLGRVESDFEAIYSPTTLLGLARVTKPHSDKLPHRNAFLERILPVLTKKYGHHRVQAYMETRRLPVVLWAARAQDADR